MLIDFEGGKRTRSDDPKTVLNETPLEVLIMDADGHLTVHSSQADVNDQERRRRFEAWRQWVMEVAQANRSLNREHDFGDRMRRR